jgi:hypothetical protein
MRVYISLKHFGRYYFRFNIINFYLVKFACGQHQKFRRASCGSLFLGCKSHVYFNSFFFILVLISVTFSSCLICTVRLRSAICVYRLM